MKRVKIILNSFYLQNLQHSVQNNYIHLNGAMKLNDALKSLHDEYTEENPFAEATSSDAEDACQTFHLQDINKGADDSELIISTFLLRLKEATKYEQFFILFSNTFEISNETLTQI